MNKIATDLTDTVNNFIEHSPKPDDWAYKPAADKWSAKEIIGHLTDSAQINLQRFVPILDTLISHCLE